MRRTLSLLAAALVTACASASPPPGGPEDKAPPLLLSITPDTNALNVHPKVASFQFDKVINDRGTGDQEVGRFFMVSPSDGEANVSWHRSRIDVSPRHGFKPNIAYSVTLLPGLTDLRGNRMKEGKSLVFATGASIPPYRINGIVFDWTNQVPAQKALVEALIPGPDSVRYLAQTDSLGKFSIGPMGAGTFLVRAIIDQNGNRSLDRNEAFDSAHVSTPFAGTLEMLTALRDTLPTRILTVSGSDSITLSVAFDHYIDPTVTLMPASFRLLGPDSNAVPIVYVRSPRQVIIADSLARRASDDSLRRADSLAGKPLRQVPPVGVVAPGAKAPPPPPPKPSIPPPYTTLTIRVARPLIPNTVYRLTATDIRALSKHVQSSERTFTTPKPAPPKAKADSTAIKPPAGATPPPTRPPTT